MNPAAIAIQSIEFIGKNARAAELQFPTHFNFIYGASNTGKSFAVKAIDFMLGGNKELPAISERKPYNQARLSLTVGRKEKLLLVRALAGGDFTVVGENAQERILGSRHNQNSDDNLSSLLLGFLDSKGREVAKDKSGTKRALSFRDLVRLCIADETAIQAERSPVESGDLVLAAAERNCFKYILTGVDDSALITQQRPKDFKTQRSAQVLILEELISKIDTELSEDYPDKDELDAAASELDKELGSLEQEIELARQSIQSLLQQKRLLSRDISLGQQRLSDLTISLDNFEQLESVYSSDLARLEALEEASFLLSIPSDKDCPICGAPPAAQLHEHRQAEVGKFREAAVAEILKITVHTKELTSTTQDVAAELRRTTGILESNQERLRTVEQSLLSAAPAQDERQSKFAEIIPRRDRLKRGQSLLRQRDDLEKEKIRLEKLKQVKPKTNFQAGLSTGTAQEFADEVAGVLQAWGFPGNCRTFFDLETHDLIIDGKSRRDNGKGVRAITHAAFKVALLTFCRTRHLPHPGFLILDTPLITYRDPLLHPTDPLTPEDNEIRKSNVKEKFFEHLGSLSKLGQFIVFDNADPPSNAGGYASIQVFTDDPNDERQGLLWPEASSA